MFAHDTLRIRVIILPRYIDKHQYSNYSVVQLDTAETRCDMNNSTTQTELKVLPTQACCENCVLPHLTDTAAKRVAALFKALANPARLQILDILSQHAGEVCACDFEGVVGLPDKETGQRPKQPTISHHLRVLRKAGLIGAQKRGLWIYYFVRRERLAEVRALLNALLD